MTSANRVTKGVRSLMGFLWGRCRCVSRRGADRCSERTGLEAIGAVVLALAVRAVTALAHLVQRRGRRLHRLPVAGCGGAFDGGGMRARFTRPLGGRTLTDAVPE